MVEGKKKKSHHARQSGTKAKKKQAKRDRREGKSSSKGQNPKAFGRSSAGLTARVQQRRKAEIQERKLHVPLIDRSYTAKEPPPYVVAVVVRMFIFPLSCQHYPHAQSEQIFDAGSSSSRKIDFNPIAGQALHQTCVI